MEREHQFLIELIRFRARGEGGDVPPAAGVDPGRLQSLLRAHRLLPTLYPALERCDLPGPWLAGLADEVRALRFRSAGLLLELGEVVRALGEAGARPLVLKGPALLSTAYGGDGRFFSDLDVLVERERTEAAYAALRGLGYRFTPTVRHRVYYDRYHFHRILDKPGVIVELHWDLTRPGDYYGVDLAGLRTRAETARSDGLSFEVPSPADQLLHGAIQLLQDGFFDVRRVVDAALVLREGRVAGEVLADAARRGRLQFALWLLLRLTELIARVAPPAGLERLRPGPVRRTLLRSLGLPARLVRGEDPHAFATGLLARSLVAPSLRLVWGESRGYVSPSEFQLLEQGLAPDELPGLARRAAFALRRSLDLGKVGSYLLWRVATQAATARSNPAL